MRPSMLAPSVNFASAGSDGPRSLAAFDARPPRGAGLHEGPAQAWLLELAKALQTTLEPETLLGLFSDRCATLVPHDAVELVTTRYELHVATGILTEHRCSYDLVVEERRLGQLTFSRREPFTPVELLMLETALANLVYPLRNAMLYREALDAAARDPLTGLNNRGSLDAILEREVELSRRHGTPLAVVMMDLDHFKSINDHYGHAAGDRTLQAIAQCMRSCARDSDMVFRYGGEEFCAVLSNTGIDGAARLAERMRSAVREMPPVVGLEAVRLSVSLGVAELRYTEHGAALLERADSALFAAKRAGRDRVTRG